MESSYTLRSEVRNIDVRSKPGLGAGFPKNKMWGRGWEIKENQG